MKANSKEVIQGYVLTSAKYDFSKYEKLILYKMVELAQSDLKGKKLDFGYSISKNLFEDRIIEIPIKDFLPDGDKNHSQVKKALISLRNKTIEYEDNKEWRLIGVVEKPLISKYSDTIKFEVQPMIWNAILNFSKGHSKYELNAAMKFKSVYAMRFFEMFSKNLKPLTFNIDNLKERFGLSEKYKNRNSDFIKRVVVPAKKELDLKSEYSFSYTLIKKVNKFYSIKFVPYYIASNKDEKIELRELKKKISLRFDVSKETLQFLNHLGFENEGIRNNLKLFKEANSRIDLYSFLKNISRKALEAKSPPAYVVGSLRKYLSSKENETTIDLKQSAKINDLLNGISSIKTT